MNNPFNKRILYLIPIFFFIIIALRINYSYNDIQQRKFDFALKEAEVLNNYALTHRTYYQKFFLNKTIPFNEKTLPALPAYSSHPISKIFSQNNSLDITIRTVSDRARNPKNSADKSELKAIEYFKKDVNRVQYFSDEESDYYQFAHALRIEQKCLLCHDKKENAPLFIQQRYDAAYDYKLGEVRGIESIKVSKEKVNSYFMKTFIYSVIYDLFLFIILFIAIFILIKKSKKINDYLEEQIKNKTSELTNSLTKDRLTKLPNRLQLLEDISNIGKDNVHLALLNIDRFKDINDFYGHDVGDVVLLQITSLIKSNCSNKKSYIYKMPSDEFAILTTKKITDGEFSKLIKSILETIEATKIEAKEHSIFISLSAGLSSKKEHLLPTADMALKASKNTSENIITYNNSINNSSKIEENIRVISLIKDAISDNQIKPFFQPIFNVHTQKIEKYEALVRIVHSDGTIITPYEFLNIAIKSKLYSHITQIMIEKTFDFFKDKDYEFSINLSMEDINNKKTTQFIIQKLKKFPHPGRVVFEILESEEIKNYEKLKNFIKTIKSFGCKFAIDDFGSGYSNFAHILELNVDYLKIDASLVKYITTDESSRVITKTIVNFASTLGLKTIAEFVEDKDSLDMLQKMGVDYIQGYYIGKPQEGLNTTF